MNETNLEDVLFNPHLEDLINSTSPEVEVAQSPSNLLLEILYVFLCLVSSLANLIIIYVILFFERTRKISNILAANWAVCDLFASVAAPVILRLFVVLQDVHVPKGFFCFLFVVENISKCAELIFVALLAVNWQLETYHQKTFNFCKRRVRGILLGTWLVILFIFGLCSGLCIDNFWIELVIWCIHLLYILMLVYSIFLHVFRLFKRTGNATPLTALVLVTVFLVMLFPDIFYFSGFYVFSQVLILLDPLVVFCLLYKFDEDFQACFVQALKRDGVRYEEQDQYE